MVATTIQYDVFKLRTVTYCENLLINLMYVSKSECRFYLEVNYTVLFLSGVSLTNISIYRTTGEGECYFFNSTLPFLPARYQLGNYCRTLTSVHNQQPFLNWFPNASHQPISYTPSNLIHNRLRTKAHDILQKLDIQKQKISPQKLYFFTRGFCGGKKQAGDEIVLFAGFCTSPDQECTWKNKKILSAKGVGM